MISVGQMSSQSVRTINIAPKKDDNKTEEMKETKPQPSLQEQFDSLILLYQACIKANKGGGKSAQEYVDTVYAQLTQFAEMNPAFTSQIPGRHIVENDGSNGMHTAVTNIAKNALYGGNPFNSPSLTPFLIYFRDLHKKDQK